MTTPAAPTAPTAPAVPAVPAAPAPFDAADLLDLPADRGGAALALARLDLLEATWEGWKATGEAAAGAIGRRDGETAGCGTSPVFSAAPAASADPADPAASTAATNSAVSPTPAEAFHRVRTSARRLRSVLRAYRQWLGGRRAGRLAREIRSMMNATSPGRDLDVQLAWIGGTAAEAPAEARAGVAWVQARLERRRAKLREAEARALRDGAVDLARARERLSATDVNVGPAPTLARVVAAAARNEAGLLAESLAGVLTLADRERAHRARIHAKRLRYLLEPFASALQSNGFIRRVTRLQDDLGELRDAQVLAEVLSALLRKSPPDTVDGLKWLAERCSAREVAAWNRLAAEWLGGSGEGPAGEIVAGARRLAAELEGRGIPAGPPLEIERKYLLSTLPPAAEGAPFQEIRQGYLPGKVIVERLRHVRNDAGERWYRTVKTGRGIARVELEEEVDPALFDALWPLTEGRRLEKRRYLVPEGEFTWEVDAFTDRPLVLAEVELPNEVLEPAIPHWLRPFLLREVTGEAEYLNWTLAR